MTDWKCENCGNTEMEHLYKRSEYNGNKDTKWYCSECNPELAGECESKCE